MYFMLKHLLLLLLIPALLIPTAFAIQDINISFDEFCDIKEENNQTSAADYICELDIFQMKDDIDNFESRIAYIESLTIPNYEKNPIVSNVNIDASLGFFSVNYTSQSFYDNSWIGMIIIDGNNAGQYGINERISMGLHEHSFGPFNMTDWNNGIGTFKITSNIPVIVIFEDSFEIP